MQCILLKEVGVKVVQEVQPCEFLLHKYGKNTYIDFSQGTLYNLKVLGQVKEVREDFFCTRLQIPTQASTQSVMGTRRRGKRNMYVLSAVSTRSEFPLQ